MPDAPPAIRSAKLIESGEEEGKKMGFETVVEYVLDFDKD
jgi:hypothetical protein